MLEIDAKFYLCIFIYYLHVFNVHMHSKGVLFPLEFVPFFMSRLCICCTLEMSQKPKNKISRTKILGEKKVWVVDVWIKQLKLPVISQEPDFNTLSHIAESKNSPLVSTWNISFTERLWTVCLNGFFLATNSGTYPRNVCFAVI